ncbi:uncharacterized protein LOC129597604 [Paramacrobiotus metropolitanus]|uniref:uncharacterized protein LOC129597604 n=1 Tax=Paramacrobiotus metropolitanus TaxID=2943436 RepID=UPI00244588B7|nr:uncharacterized protein LOC129597604 [Paramacrobiotus metropolitanus]XP_055351204.1 uncharacterized protein LOC129597604 [Paramacrobiotus metropolitanus]
MMLCLRQFLTLVLLIICTLHLDSIQARRAAAHSSTSDASSDDEYTYSSRWMTTTHRPRQTTRYHASSSRYGSSRSVSDTGYSSRYGSGSSYDSDHYRTSSRTASTGNARHSSDSYYSSGSGSRTTTAPRWKTTSSRYSSSSGDYFGYTGRPSSYRRTESTDGYYSSRTGSGLSSSRSYTGGASDYASGTSRYLDGYRTRETSRLSRISPGGNDYSYNSASWRSETYSATTKKPSSLGKVMSSITGMLGSSSSHSGGHKTGSSSSGALSSITSLLGGGSSKSGLSGGSGSSSSGMSKYLMPALTFGGKHLAKMVAKKFGSGGSKSGGHSTGALAASGAGIGSVAGLLGFGRGSSHSRQSGGYVAPIGPIPDTSGYADPHARVQPPNRAVPIGQPITTTESVPIMTPAMNDRKVVPFMSFTSTTHAPESQQENHNIDPCLLVQWNYEFKFTELPNLLVGLIANDSASGESVQDKFNFLQVFVAMIAEMSETVDIDHSEAVFRIPEGYSSERCRPNGERVARSTADGSLATRCDIARRMRMTLPECHIEENPTERPLEWTFTTRPVHTAIEGLHSVYLNPNRSTNDFKELVRSVKNCYAHTGRPRYEQQHSCLDFHINPETILSNLPPDHHNSLFGNKDVCRQFLNFDLLSCANPNPVEGDDADCSIDDLLVINAFSRNIYLCSHEIEPEMIEAIQRRFPPSDEQ